MPSSLTFAAASIALAFAFAGHFTPVASQNNNPISEFKTVVTKLATEPSTDFNPETKPSANLRQNEALFVRFAAETILDALNSESGEPASITNKALRNLNKIVDSATGSWPKENQFRYKTLDLSPLIVVKLGIRSRETFRAFGLPLVNGPEKRQWVFVNYTDIRSSFPYCDDSLELFPLRRGPDKNPRFLASYDRTACGSGREVNFVGYEWAPSDTPTWGAELREVLRRNGLPDEDRPQWGFSASGSVVKLSYCWHSAVDSYARPVLCSTDTYNVSGDRVRFVNTTTNHPDLEVVARVIEHAQARELGAVRGYCTNEITAQNLVSQIPADHFFASDGLSTIPAAEGSETVELRSGDVQLRFVLRRQNSRWLVSAFHIDPL